MSMDRCWKTIGVWGTESPRCELLEEIVHCFNCREFKEAGRGLFDREPAEDAIREATDLLAQPRRHRETSRDRVIVFRLGREWFGMPLPSCLKVIPASPVCPVPHRDPWVVEGLVNVGGRLLPCVSLPGLLGIESGTGEDEDRAKPLIVVQLEGQEVAFPVQEILETSFARHDLASDPPGGSGKDSPSLAAGVIPCQGHEVSCLDPELLRQAVERRLA